MCDMWFRKRKLGCIPDSRDSRDYQLLSIQKDTVPLPDEYDLRILMSPIGYQNFGSCWSWGTTAIKEYLDSEECGKTINLSEKFVYHTGKKISGLWGIQGDYIRTGLKALCEHGAPLLADYPDTKEKNWEVYAKKEPPLEIYKKAEKYRGKTYWAVGKSLEEIRQAIYQQKAPIVFGMMWFKGYKPTSDGRLPLPSGKNLGGHCLSIVGWTKNKLWIRNSWGAKFGLNGYFYIPFGEFEKHDTFNAWILLDQDKPQATIGWVAEKFIEKAQKFAPNEIIKSTVNSLRIRENPTTNSSILGSLQKGENCTIVHNSQNGIEANGYRWWYVKKI